MRIAGADCGRRGTRSRCMPASAGVRPPFLRLHGDAAGDDIFPILAAALGDRHHMIEGEIAGGEFFAAVLAKMLVTCVNIGARKRHVVEAALYLDVAEQTDNRWEPEAEGNSPDFPVVHRDDLNLALAPERDRLLPVDNLEGLIGRVKKKRLFHVRFETPPAERRVNSARPLSRCQGSAAVNVSQRSV